MQMTCNMSFDNPRFKLSMIPDGPEKALDAQFEDLWLQLSLIMTMFAIEYILRVISDCRFDPWKFGSTYLLHEYIFFSFS